MKRIPLNDGLFAMVDDEDEQWLLRYKWQADKRKTLTYAKRHVCFNGTKTTIRMHRMVTGLMDPKIQIDHVDGNGLNNQKENLRVCVHSQNSQNRRLRSDNKTGFRGVNPRRGGKWEARIFFNGKKEFLGTFDTKEEAARAYDVAAWKKSGQFARLNFPDEAKTTLPVITDGLLETSNQMVIRMALGTETVQSPVTDTEAR